MGFDDVRRSITWPRSSSTVIFRPEGNSMPFDPRLSWWDFWPTKRFIRNSVLTLTQGKGKPGKVPLRYVRSWQRNIWRLHSISMSFWGLAMMYNWRDIGSHRLAEVLKHQAMLLERIVTEQRFYPDYFRVAFYGDFPAALRNKEFIVRSLSSRSYWPCSRICSTVSWVRVGEVWRLL